jgi:hypothetical protein
VLVLSLPQSGDLSPAATGSNSTKRTGISAWGVAVAVVGTFLVVCAVFVGFIWAARTYPHSAVVSFFPFYFLFSLFYFISPPLFHFCFLFSFDLL